MNDMKEQIIIIGGGLSGLLTGYRFKKEGIPFKIIEARNRIGGRIHTIQSAHSTPIEMGATWFGDQHNHLIELLNELGIPYFEQYMKGTSFFQPFSTSPASAIPIPSQPPSYRISGGTSTLIHTLASEIGSENIELNQNVKRIDFFEDSIIVKATNKSFKASKIVLAVPPKLWNNTIEFSPPLPKELNHIASTTHTWMEESIKVALTFDHPFWRQKKQSGTLFSNTGPITEFYDHCNFETNKYALCGFINSGFNKLTFDERKKQTIKQLTPVFGTEIQDYSDYNERVWSLEENTYSESITPLYPHQNNGNPIYHTTYFDDRLLISSAEASPIHPGYMEGAIVSANLVTKKIRLVKD